MRDECFIYLKQQKFSIVRVVIIGLVFVAILSLIRGAFFYDEIKRSIVKDVKKEARIVTDYFLSMKSLWEKNCLDKNNQSLNLSEILPANKKGMYIKYISVKPMQVKDTGDIEELLLVNYFTAHNDKREYFKELNNQDDFSYQYAIPIYFDSKVSSCYSNVVDIHKPQGIVSVRISHDKAFKNLYGLIFKEIVFLLLTVVMMIVLLVVLYKNTKKQMTKIDDAANAYAFKDALTGLYNRHYLNHFLEKFTPLQNEEKCFGVLFIDIDDFKKINDLYGHMVGDCVLKELGDKLRFMTRKEDLLCRYGGEEFLIVLSEMTPELVVKRSETLRKSVESMKLNCEKKDITISIGVSCGHNNDDISIIIDQSDKALYEAKASGKNCIKLFNK